MLFPKLPVLPASAIGLDTMAPSGDAIGRDYEDASNAVQMASYWARTGGADSHHG